MSRMLSITQWGRVIEGDGSRQDSAAASLLEKTAVLDVHDG